MTERRQVVLNVIRALARADDVEPHQLDYSLQEHIDTDSLEQLAALEGSEWTLTFSVPDHEVAVHSDGRVVVDGEKRVAAEANELEQ